MLTLDRFHHVQTGEPLRGFFIRNRKGKIIATGADGAFVVISHQRYVNDTDLVRAVEKLANMSARSR